ncbi:T9SS type B sorting domain-containing protein [Gramella sp. AN32]|uniref:T9SS type B sorting domain-containing protein n=1 Tax=Christiangramia antarctica TaxID=2058158 RepID=A0ABW5X6D1_9FLAO|nr:T9SS type B sorting domain-containing protein [Gramella sp. AN32]MCM4155875.1 hypothetical protein [Gramella sp. AN32]
MHNISYFAPDWIWGMRIKEFSILFIVYCFFTINGVQAQGALCDQIEPFCAGNERLTFPNSNPGNSTQSTGEFGPDYGCLEETPYPSWFFLKVEDPGNLEFRISQYANSNGTGAPLDVDFVVWGPFKRDDPLCTNSALSGGNIVDCSYLPDAVEIMRIPNAEANSVYVVMITNFERIRGFISLQQSNTGGNQGSTDCSILGGSLGGNVPVCGETEYTLDGTTDEADLYQWYIFNENTGNFDIIPGADNPVFTVTESGVYRLEVIDTFEEVSATEDVTVTFYDNPQVGEANDLFICAESTETIDLTSTASELISANANPSNYTVIYYDNNEDAENDNNEIENPGVYPFESGKEIFARVLQLESECLSPVTSFRLSSFVFPEISIDESTLVCVDINGNLQSPFQIGTNIGNDYSFEWTAGTEIISTEPILNITELPSVLNFNLSITHIPSGCQTSLATQVIQVSPPESVSVEVSGSDFGNGYTVKVLPGGGLGLEFPGYEYQLDDGSWTGNDSFRDVPPGVHTVSVRDAQNCGQVTSEPFFLIGYKRFFSPNGDGYNDTWNIISDNSFQIEKLYVFDRYGKLLKQLDPSSNKGWDGTFNGVPLPADDYWFKIQVREKSTNTSKEYSTNFSLIR